MIPEPVRGPLSAFVAGLGGIHREAVLAVWLAGSWARGCGVVGHSDLDLLLVLRGEVTPEQQAETAAHAADQCPGCDLTAVTEDQLRADVWPTPVHFLVKGGGTLVQQPEGSRDSLLLRQDVAEAGLRAYGHPHAGSARPVPWRLLQSGIDHVLPHLRSHFDHPALVLCRVAFACVHRRLCSKVQAGEWALRALPAALRGAVRADPQSYQRGTVAELDGHALAHLEHHGLLAAAASRTATQSPRGATPPGGAQGECAAVDG
ncbi:MAG: aminoglycoside adenylyltransferase domain-containing protein [Candidatus Latescibacterota bacterium]